MGNIKYTRANLFQFIQTTLRLNKSDTKYFDLINKDKLLISVESVSGTTKSYLIKSDIGITNQSNDSLLIHGSTRDMRTIGTFCDSIDILLERLGLKKSNLIQEFGSFDDYNNEVNFDFDNIDDK